MEITKSKKSTKKVDDKIKIHELDSIEVHEDKDSKKYTNESLLELLNNRAKGIMPPELGNFGDNTSDGWIPPVGNFNIYKSVKWIEKAAYSHYIKGVCGKCARFVRLALEQGGINTDGHPGSAYQYAEFLPKKGFKKITVLDGKAKQSAFTSNYAKPGDIAVMEHGEHGHICLYTGKRWISDFVQNNMWVYSGEGTCKIFRYTTA